MNRVKKVLLVFTLLVACLALLCTRLIAHGEGSLPVTVTVRPTPLVVTVSAPSSVCIGQRFKVRATIENRADTKIEKAVATIGFDPDEGLTLVGGNAERTIRVILPHKEKTALWSVKADQAGTYTIRASASGKDKLIGILLEAEGQTEVEVVEACQRGFGHAVWSRILHIFKLLFGG